jgi:hypothetical protein
LLLSEVCELVSSLLVGMSAVLASLKPLLVMVVLSLLGGKEGVGVRAGPLPREEESWAVPGAAGAQGTKVAGLVRVVWKRWVALAPSSRREMNTCGTWRRRGGV